MHGTPFDIPADLDTPVSAYMKLAPFDPRFLLESVEGGEQLGRYSFIGLGVSLDAALTSGSLLVGGESRQAPTTRDGILDALREALRRCGGPEPVAGVPFPGGLVGAVGYGVSEWLDRRQGHEPPEAAYARFVAPRSVLAFDHMTRRAALLHEGTEAERRSLREELVSALRGPVPWRRQGTSVDKPRASFDQPAFEAAVGRVQDYIRSGDIYQLVLSVRFEAESDLEPFQVYRALRLLNPSPYMYYLDFDDLQVVGSSPEALVRLEGREAFLRPIAGTRPRGQDLDEDQAFANDLLADPKENAEHVMLVDLARNDLGRVAVPGTVAVQPFRVIERYSHVIHMVSGVRGVLAPGVDAFDLFAASFPAGTVVGAPKIRAAEIIRELEPVPRGLYAGSVGYFGRSGSMDQAITIRTLVFRNGSCSFQAGAGIVADSVPSREYDEVLSKSAALRSALALAGEGI